MARLHYNGLVTTLAGSGLTSSGTTVTFTAALTHAGGVAVPTLAGGDVIRLALLTPGGALSEIVELTAYTSAATTGTITRGVEGTTGVAHAVGDPVVTAAFATDVHLSAVRVNRSAAYTFVQNTNTAVPFDAEDVDTDGFHDNVTNNSRLTVPTGLSGTYLVIACVNVTSLASGSRFQLNINKNGSAVGWRSDETVGATAAYGTCISGIVPLVATDFIEASYFCSAASAALNIGLMSMHKIGSA